MSIDRARRNQIADMIRRYLAEDITAFEFDDQLFAIDHSSDPAVFEIVYSLWHFYDDCIDHTVVMDKTAWDYIQRILLILESDAPITNRSRRIWCLPQVLACGCLAVMIWAVYVFGWGLHLFLLTPPLGAISILISRWRFRFLPSFSREATAIYPFACIADLLSTRRSVPGFEKRRFPNHIAGKKIRTDLDQEFCTLRTYISWLLFSPAVLLYQSLPIFHHQISVDVGR